MITKTKSGWLADYDLNLTITDGPRIVPLREKITRFLLAIALRLHAGVVAV